MSGYMRPLTDPPLPGWLGTLTPEHREAVFSLMRAVDAEAMTHESRARSIEGNGSRIPVGAGHFDDLLAAVVREEFLSALRRGATPTEAIDAARAGARICVKKHNARSKDMHWQRSSGAGDQLCETLGPRFARVAT